MKHTVALRLPADSKRTPAPPSVPLWEKFTLLAKIRAVNPLKQAPRDVSGWTPLHMAVLQDDAAALQSLLARGMDPDTANAAGVTPLMLACNRGQADAAEMLLEARSTIDLQGGADKMTALMLAAKQGHEACVGLLLADNAAIDLSSFEGKTARDYAARHPACVQLIDDAIETRTRHALALDHDIQLPAALRPIMRIHPS